MRLLVKIGGAQLEGSGPRAEFAAAVRGARALGHEVLVVHGGGDEVRRLGERLGLAERRVDGLRVTDEATAEVVLAVLGGTVNRRLVRALLEAGVDAVGLTGADGGIWTARRHSPGGADLGFVGQVDQVRPALLEHLLARGYVPVLASVAPPTPGAGEEDAPFYNVNADHAAAPLATALEADAVLFLTDVPGLLDGQGELVHAVSPRDCARLERAGVLKGGMLPKVQAALSAAAAAPLAVVKIAPAAGKDALVRALDEATGTRFRAEEALRG